MIKLVEATNSAIDTNRVRNVAIVAVYECSMARATDPDKSAENLEGDYLKATDPTPPEVTLIVPPWNC